MRSEFVSNRRHCVISGLGLATPAGNNPDDFWQTLEKGSPLFQKLEVFAGNNPYQYVSQVDNELLQHDLTKRQLKKLDRFTILSLAAAKGSLEDSDFALNDESRQRLGIILGNCTGGWGYVEPMMYPLYTQGMEAINPYVATAWFPAAPQGEISILHRIGGYSKTIAADRISSGVALEQSVWIIQADKADAMMAGGTESPLSALVLNAFLQAGYISSQNQYQPFSSEADGYLLGEGAAILLVEAKEQAQKRGAKIYAEVLAIAKGNSLSNALHTCLSTAGLGAQDIDYIVLDAFGIAEKDDEEYQAIDAVLGTNSNLRMSSPKSMYGNLIGANMALDLAVACLSLERQTVLPTAIQTGTLKTAHTGKHVVGKPESCPLKHVLVNSRDQDGQSLVVLLSQPEEIPL